jgi:hypothetical protein
LGLLDKAVQQNHLPSADVENDPCDALARQSACPALPRGLCSQKGTQGQTDGKAKRPVLDVAANNPAILTAEGFQPVLDWLRPPFGAKKLGWQSFQSLRPQLLYLIWYIKVSL